MKYFHVCLSLSILLSVLTIARSADPDCVYTVYVKTGSIHRAGTDSNITLTLYDSPQNGIQFLNLEAWGGLMGPDYNYFTSGNLDVFSGKGPCLKGPVCGMVLKSDGTGRQHEWYVEYVEVTTTGVNRPCAQKTFTVEQWLGKDTTLSVTRNDCKSRTRSINIDGQDLSKIPTV